MPLDLSNLKIHEPVLQQMQKLSGHITFDKIDEKGSNGYTCFGTHEILGRKMDTSKNLWANQDFIDSIGRVAEERRHGRSIPGTF